MPLTRLFYRLIVRPFYRDSLRTALVVLAVALGVAVVLAIELAGDAAAGSFRSSIETLVGDADLEVAAVGGVPDAVVGKLATLPYPIAVHPRMEGYAVVATTGQTVPLIGLDLVAERPDNLGIASATALQDEQSLIDERAVWVSDTLGVKSGDRLKLQVNDRTSESRVRGLLHNTSDAGGLVLMDIAAAQRVLGRMGRVDRVLVKVPSSPGL